MDSDMKPLNEHNFVERTAFHIKISIPVGQNDQDTINQILQDQKLRELVEKKIIELDKDITSDNADCYVVIIPMLEQLLKESKT